MDKLAHEIRGRQWAEIIAVCNSNGQGKAEWCRENGVNAVSFTAGSGSSSTKCVRLQGAIIVQHSCLLDTSLFSRQLFRGMALSGGYYWVQFTTHFKKSDHCMDAENGLELCDSSVQLIELDNNP